MTPPKTPAGERARLVTLASVLAFSVGAVAVLLVTSMPSPSWLRSDDGDAIVTTSPRSFDDARAVPAVATAAPEWVGRAPMSGVLTSVDCTPGMQLASGQAPIVINDRRILALSLRTPLWRDLDYGVEGDDVTALQEELVRLGYLGMGPDGYYGSATGEAVSALWSQVGGDPGQWWLPLSQLLWLPAPDVTVDSCAVSLGSGVGVGGELFATRTGISALAITLPMDLPEEPRVAYVDEVSTPVPADGVITDPDFLKRYAETPRYLSFLTDPTAQLTVDIRLERSIDAVSVPASALYALDGSTACVLADGVPATVQILGSELGNTLVHSSPLPQNVSVAPKDAPSCR